MSDSISRRSFLQDAAAVSAGVAAASEMLPEKSASAIEILPDPEHTSFASRWDHQHDRVWLGSEYWANPLQDWRIANGRIECIKAAPNRNVHLLTHQLGDHQGGLTMSVRIGARWG